MEAIMNLNRNKVTALIIDLNILMPGPVSLEDYR